MNQFRHPRIGGNVVHRIDVPTSSRRLRSRRRRGSSRAPEPQIVRGPIVALPPETRRRAPEPAPQELGPRQLPAATRPEDLEDSQARKQIQLLERRLAKMAKLLDDREAVAAAAAVPVDEGVASIYSEVQGLTGRGKDVKQKKALMSAIFEANLQLRGHLRRA